MKIVRFKTKEEKKRRRAIRVRARVSGSAERPRLSIFRSNRHMTAQLIDDVTGRTLVAAADKEIKLPAGKTKKAQAEGQTKVMTGQALGKLLAEKAQAKQITKVVFDRSGYRFTGRIKAVAEGARAGGLQF